jgi:hypothetical protein
MSSANRDGRRLAGVGSQPAYLELANWLLNQELSADGEPTGVTEAAQRVLRKLLRRLARLITPIGCQALLSRALHLARVDYPFLGQLEAGVTDDAWLPGLQSGVDGLDAGLARDGLAALLGTLIGLVELFIGHDLTWRLLLDFGWDLPGRTS